MSDIIVKMQEYNTLIERRNKGEKFLDNPSISIQEKMKHVDRFINLLKQISELQETINTMGYRITDNDLLYGIGKPKGGD